MSESKIRRMAKKQGLKASYWTAEKGTVSDENQTGWHFVDMHTNSLVSSEAGLDDEQAYNWLLAE